MKQVRLVAPENVILEEVEKPAPKASEVLIQVKRIGVCGSDIHAYYDKHPYISCPIVQGHEFSGEIVEMGDAVSGLTVGDRVTVMPQLVCGECYPCTHGDYHICNTLKVIGCQADGAAREFIPVDQKLVLKLPQGLSLDHGAMVEPVAVGVHAVQRLGIVSGMKLLVFGAGPIGNLTAQVAKGLGAESVMIVDISNFRLDVARQCGVDFVVNTSEDVLEQRIDSAFGPDRADAILECVGVQDTITQAVENARKGTTIVVVGVFGKVPEVDLGLVQDRELSLVGTLMYQKRDYERAIELVAGGKLCLDQMITQRFPFKDYLEAYEMIEASGGQYMKVMIELDTE